MKRFVQGRDRTQGILLPEQLEDYVTEDNPVRVVDVFVDSLNLGSLGFDGAQTARIRRPSYHSGVLIEIYIYGYLNRVQSSRRLEREAQCNIEVIWLTNRLTPDFKTIADFRKTNIAIDGSKFKAVNNRDKNFTDKKLQARIEQLESNIARYLEELDRGDRRPESVPESRVAHLK